MNPIEVFHDNIDIRKEKHYRKVIFMKRRMLAIVLALVLLLSGLSACGTADAKATYKPPAEVFNVKVSGTSEPEIDGVKFTYDSKARIDTVSYTTDGYEYKQEYTYDAEKIVIKTIYKTEVIEEKVIRYVDIPVDSGYTSVDGYYICVTDEMPVNGNNNVSDNASGQKTESQKSVNWKNLYISYLNEFIVNNEAYVSNAGDELMYSLIFIDDNDIPELVIAGPAHVNPTYLCWISGEKVVEQQLDAALNHGVTYIASSGLIKSRGLWQGTGGETVYQLTDGELIELAHGSISSVNNRYTWNDSDVSENEYNDKLNAVFDVSKAKDVCEFSYSYNQILERLK